MKAQLEVEVEEDASRSSFRGERGAEIETPPTHEKGKAYDTPRSPVMFETSQEELQWEASQGCKRRDFLPFLPRTNPMVESNDILEAVKVIMRAVSQTAGMTAPSPLKTNF